MNNKEILRYLDLFGTKCSFYTEQKLKLYTPLGGILSIISFITGIFIFIYTNISSFKRKEPKIITSSIIEGHQKIKLKNEKINDIISSNEFILDTLNGIKVQLDNIIKNSTINLMNNQLKNINIILNTLTEFVKKNNYNLKNLFKDIIVKEKIIYTNINANYIQNTQVIKEETNIDMKEVNINDKKPERKKSNLERFEKFKKKLGNKMHREYNYLTGYLEYEGEFSNKKWNGIGKKYYKNKLDYVGDYLDGKRSGKGEEYNYNGNLIFEGEYLNGKRWNGKGYNNQGIIEYELKEGKGNVKEYNWLTGKLIYEGEYSNGERNGKGKEYNDKNELIFKGEYINGKKWNGKGKEYKYEYLIYEGDYFNGQRNGKGKEYNDLGKLIYEGDYLNRKRNGKGKEYNDFGKLIYEGGYLNGNWNGIGKEYFKNGKLKYFGEFLDGKYDVKGKKYFKNGKIKS